jgi:hypothetical protein
MTRDGTELPDISHEEQRKGARKPKRRRKAAAQPAKVRKQA